MGYFTFFSLFAVGGSLTGLFVRQPATTRSRLVVAAFSAVAGIILALLFLMLLTISGN